MIFLSPRIKGWIIGKPEWKLHTSVRSQKEKWTIALDGSTGKRKDKKSTIFCKNFHLRDTHFSVSYYLCTGFWIKVRCFYCDDTVTYAMIAKWSRSLMLKLAWLAAQDPKIWEKNIIYENRFDTTHWRFARNAAERRILLPSVSREADCAALPR